jgi:phage host-nuclease inhibitor protein Gam
MAIARRKAAAPAAAPATIEEAVAALAEYRDTMDAIARTRADAAEAIGKIEASRDTFVAPLEERAKALFIELRHWWAVAGEAMTEGKRRSIDLAGCKIGIRTSTPRLVLPKGMNEKAAIAWLKTLREKAGERFLRLKEALDKPAVLKVLGPEPSAMATVLQLRGFAAKQSDEFFIDASAPSPAPADPIIAGEEEKTA